MLLELLEAETVQLVHKPATPSTSSGKGRAPGPSAFPPTDETLTAGCIGGATLFR